MYAGTTSSEHQQNYEGLPVHFSSSSAIIFIKVTVELVIMLGKKRLLERNAFINPSMIYNIAL